jgi:CheY-like chemotaxis protein
MNERSEPIAILLVDGGAGIPPQQLERVFDMFARVERATSTAERGLGIGLALARRLASLHDGSLTASSEGEGLGTTFTLRLPVEAEGTLERAPSIGQEMLRAEALRRLKVIVIEDNDDVAFTLELWLQDMGQDVSVARSGASGVALVEKDRPDLVLCDLGLPEMDGLEVCRRVRGLDILQPRMVALTGWGRENDRRRTREAGFDEHLVKPVAVDRLLGVLRALS